jgi:hypothetical protein
VDNLLPARMWQDPLTTVLKDQPPGKIAQINKDAPPPVAKGEETLYLFDCVDPDKSTSEAAEERRRERYAVLSALSTAGYVPLEPDHIRYAAYSQTAAVDRAEMTKQQATAVQWEFKMPLPYEWFRVSADATGPMKYQAVCVLWVNSLTDSPRQLAFLRLLRQILSHGVPHSAFAICGRIETDQLLAMLDEEKKETRDLPARSLEGMTLYITTSTEPSVRTKGRRQDTGLRIEYVIDSDDRLAAELLDEFRMRRLHPDDHGASIAIIAERDTRYGRRMHESFKQVIKDQTHVHHYSYLRGLDGKVLSGSGDQKEGAADKPTRAGEGDSQIDYLPRLAEEMKRLDEPPKVIGIVGSDVYDKLVLLKALRPRFPEAVFFTTDLDARLLQPEDYRDTRNLLIASHFGMSLCPKLQDRVAPFRSSYDAASYVGCLRAVEYLGDPYVNAVPCPNPEPGKGLNGDKLVPKGRDKMPAHLYEVGRSGAYELTLYDEAEDPLGAGNPRRNPWVARNQRLALFGWIAACGVVVLLLVSRSWGRFVGFALTPVIVPLVRLARLARAPGVAVPAGQGPREAAQATQPVSGAGDTAGPGSAAAAPAADRHALAEAGRRAGVALRDGLAKQWRNVFFIAAAVVAVWLLTDVYRAHTGRDQEPFELFEGLSIWPTVAFRLLAVGLCVYYVLAAWESFHKQRDKARHRLFGDSAPHPAPAAGGAPVRPFAWGPGETTEVARLYEHLEGHGKPAWRALRCALMAGLSLGLLVLVWQVFTPTVVHARGPIAHCWNRAVLWTTLIVVILLVAFVVDSTVLAFRFVTSLSRLGAARQWPEGHVARTARRWGLTLPDETAAPTPDTQAVKTAVDQWLCLRLIEAVTEVVAQLIYYPFVVMLVLIVAHNRIFNDWHWNIPFAIIILVNAGAAVLCAFELQRAAKGARKQAVRVLDALLRTRVGHHHDEFCDKLTRIRADVAGFKTGAFASFRNNPVVNAILVPLFGAGGLAALEALLQYLH